MQWDKKITYAKGLELQKKAFELIMKGEFPGILFLLQHSPVITIGKAGGWENLRVSMQECLKQGIEVHETDRGGNVTYHGPGQLVGYPILNLKYWKKDLHWYLRNIEQGIINNLGKHGIKAGRKSQYTGVWVGNKKIAAIGISVKKWVTMHGFAFQITSEHINHFSLINPCGITEFGVISLEELLPRVDYGRVVDGIKADFGDVFNCSLIRTENFPEVRDKDESKT